MSKTYRELLAEQSDLDARIAAAKKIERPQAIATIHDLMDQFDITPDELVVKRGRKKTGPLPPKYRDPDSGATWSGMGREPQWIAGRDRSEFLI